MCYCEKQREKLIITANSLGLCVCSYITIKLAQDHTYVDNMCEKFQGQEMYSKEDIQNLLTWGLCVEKFHKCPL